MEEEEREHDDEEVVHLRRDYVAVSNCGEEAWCAVKAGWLLVRDASRRVHLHEDVEVLAAAEARQRRHAHQREAEQQHVPRRPRRRGDHHRRVGQPGVVDVVGDDVDEGPPVAGGRHAR